MPNPISSLDTRLLDALLDRGRPFLDLDRDQKWLSEIVSNPKAHLARMKKRGLMAPVGGGRYIALPLTGAEEISELPQGLLLAALFGDRDDYYLGYLSALIDHGLTDQHTNAIYLAVFGPTPSVRTLAGRPVHLTRIKSKRKRFGQERVRAAGTVFYFRSDLERTLLDALDRPTLYDSPEIWARSWSRAISSERVDVFRLMEYAQDWGGVVAARCAFWLRELGEVRVARAILRTIGAPLGGPRLLDPSQPFGERDWRRDRDSGLIVNIPEQAVDGWLTYGK